MTRHLSLLRKCALARLSATSVLAGLLRRAKPQRVRYGLGNLGNFVGNFVYYPSTLILTTPLPSLVRGKRFTARGTDGVLARGLRLFHTRIELTRARILQRGTVLLRDGKLPIRPLLYPSGLVSGLVDVALLTGETYPRVWAKALVPGAKALLPAAALVLRHGGKANERRNSSYRYRGD